MFANCLGVIEAAARLGGNATAGNIQKMNSHMTIGQVKRVLGKLIAEEYIEASLEAYGRTGRYIYSVTNLADTNIGIVARAIEKREAVA